MASYSFHAITAAEALAIRGDDSLTLPAGASARMMTILYLPDGGNSLTIGDRTVTFGAGFRDLAGQLFFPDGSKLYVGGDQNDLRDFSSSSSGGVMYGGDGADTLTAGAGQWLVQGNQGNDVIDIRRDQANTAYGGQGDDSIRLSTASGASVVGQFMQGNKGADTIVGSIASDTLLGGQDNDVITGGGGEDFLNGNLGDDRIVGSGRILGEDGNDYIAANGFALTTASGDAGNDTLMGREGADTLFGGSGNDSIEGAAGNDSIDGGGGDDSVYGGNDTDIVSGGAGNDLVVDIGGTANRLDAGDGNDRIAITAGSGVAFCGDGNDTLDSINSSGYTIDGGAGNDQIRGSGRIDTIIGGDGADTIDFGGGADAIYGGAGADVFQFYTYPMLTDASGVARILDWSSEDRIQFHTLYAGQRPAYEELSAGDFSSAVTLATDRLAGKAPSIMSVQVGADIIVFSGMGGPLHTVILAGRSLSDVSGDNFLF